MRRGRISALLVAIFASAAMAAAAHAGAPPTGWDGVNPFRCSVQNAGLGTSVPHPEADPYCVEFDKRHQNVTQLGVVDFLSKEPARVSSASDKCFYFQSDHWRGSLVQGDPTTKTYEFDGHYFFDRARGEGGVWVTNFNLNGRTFDPSALPGLPAQYGRYFGPGTGGFITHNQVEAEPRCVALARNQGNKMYAPPEGSRASSCVSPRGRMHRRRLGPVAVREVEATVRRHIGSPAYVHRGFLHYCLKGGGGLAVGEREDRSGDLGEGHNERAIVLLTTSPRMTHQGVHPGSRHVWRGARRVLRYGSVTVYVRNGVLAGVRRHRVRFIAVFDRRSIHGKRTLAKFLRRAGS